jgi:hypothetical protein
MAAARSARARRRETITPKAMPQQIAMLRRELHPQIRVLDADAGLVEYVASNETIDCYREVVMADGWKFDRFQKNAPFVDSHSYDSIDNLLGKVISFSVKGGQLIEVVKWAIDVPQNALALKGFAMTAAGYLRAVSVGFLPEKIISRFDSDPGDYNDALEKLDLGDDLAESIRCIYVSQQQTELSACILGANPDALARAYSDNLLEDADLLRWPALRRAIQSVQPESRRSYSFPSDPQPEPSPSMRNKSFLDTFGRLTGGDKSTITQVAEKLESARRGQSESELYRASALMRLAMARERRITIQERISEILSDPLTRNFIEALPRFLGGVRYKGNDMVRKALSPSTAFGPALLPIDVSRDIFDLVLLNGVFRHLGVVEMTAMQTKIAQVTANPTAIVIPPSLMGTTTIPADVSLTGSSLTPEAATFALLLPISRELLQNEKANLSVYLLTRLSESRTPDIGVK